MAIIGKVKKDEENKPSRQRPITWRYPFMELEVDGYFDIEIEEGEDRHVIYNRVHSAAQGHRKRHGKNLKFRVSMFRPNLIRVWRLA